MASKPENVIEATDQIKETGAKKKKSFWKGFLTFLTMGGWLLVLIVVVAIVIAISMLTK